MKTSAASVQEMITMMMITFMCSVPLLHDILSMTYFAESKHTIEPYDIWNQSFARLFSLFQLRLNEQT